METAQRLSDTHATPESFRLMNQDSSALEWIDREVQAVSDQFRREWLEKLMRKMTAANEK